MDQTADEGDCGTDSIFQEERREVEPGGERVQMLERQADYPRDVGVGFVPEPMTLEMYVTLDGRVPTQQDYDRYTDEPGEAEILIDDGVLDPGDTIGVLVVATDGPEAGGEYGVILTEPTTETVQPVANLSVVTDDPLENDPLTVDGSESFARFGSLESYEWTWIRGGSGDSGSGEQFTFVPENAGTYRIILEVTDEVGNFDRIEEYVDVGDDGGFCFITTATAREQSTLDSLRRFRDDSMATTPVGRGLVGLYDRISPPIARALERHPESRTARLCRWYVRRCAALSDRQRDHDTRPGTAALGALVATLYVVGVLIAAAGYAGIRLSELLFRSYL